MFKILFGLVAALFFSSAFATITPTTGYCTYGSYAIPYTPRCPASHASVAAVCEAGAGYMTAYSASSGSNYVYAVTSTAGGRCYMSGTAPGGGVFSYGPYDVTTSGANPACPANSTLSGGTCVCNSGYAEDGGACVVHNPECTVGQGRTFNRTEGWALRPGADANDVINDLGPPSSPYNYNDGVCVGNLTGVERCYRSQEPSAQGLYRISCDYTMVISGTSTSSGDENAKPDTPNATCPGIVGTVNGKPVCVGTSSSPLPNGTDAPNEPTSAGNPAAGPKPSTGPGSGSDGAGRTPATGSGGNSGGPAGAAVGRGGTGDRGDGPDDGTAVCGAAPLPACNVKVDETGTPTASEADSRFTQANTDLGKVQTDADAAFGDHRDISLPAWSWTFQFPTGCTPLVLPAFDDFEIDVCQFQPVIHDLMSVLWVIAGIWGLINLFMRASGV